MSKLDARLQALVSGGTSRITMDDMDSSVRADGAREYQVIIHGSSAEDVRGTGVKVLSAFGGVLTARVSTDEIRALVGLGTVRFIETGSRNVPQ
jgi:hypothetical protein